MPTARNYSNTASQASLASAIGATDTAINLTAGSFTGYPAAPFTATLARGTANEEVVLVTVVSGNTVTVTRGYDGTAAKAQGAGTTFQEVAAAVDFADANAHHLATSGVHGATGPVVGTTDTQTLTNKTLTAPTITGPTITGTATVATANVTTLTVSGVTTLASGSFSGNVTVGGTLGVTGTATLAGLSAQATTVTTLTATGTSTLAAVGATNITASGTLGVTGASTLAGVSAQATTVTTLTTSGAASLASGTVTAAPVNAADLVRKDYVDTAATKLVAASSDAVAHNTTGTTETKVGPGLTGMALATGRAYEIGWAGLVSTTGAAGIVGVRVRAAAAGAATTTASTSVSGTQVTTTASGGSGQNGGNSLGQPFQLSAASANTTVDVWAIASGTGVTAGATLPLAGGVAGVTVKDLGPAPAGLRTLTL